MNEKDFFITLLKHNIKMFIKAAEENRDNTQDYIETAIFETQRLTLENTLKLIDETNERLMNLSRG